MARTIDETIAAAYAAIDGLEAAVAESRASTAHHHPEPEPETTSDGNERSSKE